MIKDVKITSLKTLSDERGKVMHMLRKDSKVFKSFGEIYFNEIIQNKKKGWIKHKKNQCIFAVAFGEIIFKLVDGRKKSKSFLFEENITLSKKKYNLLVVPPGVWFCFSTKKKKSVLVNLINNPHSDNESIKSDKINNI